MASLLRTVALGDAVGCGSAWERRRCPGTPPAAPRSRRRRHRNRRRSRWSLLPVVTAAQSRSVASLPSPQSRPKGSGSRARGLGRDIWTPVPGRRPVPPHTTKKVGQAGLLRDGNQPSDAGRVQPVAPGFLQRAGLDAEKLLVLEPQGLDPADVDFARTQKGGAGAAAVEIGGEDGAPATILNPSMAKCRFEATMMSAAEKFSPRI